MIALIAIIVVFLKVVPEWLAQDDLKGKDRAEDVGRARTASLAILAGLLAVTGAVFTGLTYRLGRAGQITDRFTKAIDQLGNDSMDVRLGGIYALERIARDSRHDHPQVMEVLTAYVREHSPWVPPPEGEQPARPRLPTDIQAVMEVIGRRKLTHDAPGEHLDLMATDLRRLRLWHDRAHLENASLSSAHLEEAYLLDAHLDGVALIEAHLEDAYLVGASLRGAMVFGAHLEGANLLLADLEGADLRGALWDRNTRWPDGFDYEERTGPEPG